MLIRNGLVFCDDFRFRRMDIRTKGRKIEKIAPALSMEDEEIIDAEGKMVVPGMIDIHIHGAVRYDVLDGTKEAMTSIAQYLASIGVTGFAGATIAYDQDKMESSFRCMAEFAENEPEDAAVFHGINLEGPFSGPSKAGAHPPEYLIQPDPSFFFRMHEASGHRVRFLTVAPELEGAMELIQEAVPYTRVAVGHSAADYEQAKEAFQRGASHITHLFNAMTPFSQRAPGIIGAACEYTDFAELICDGMHVHPSVVYSAFQWFRDRICIVSDAILACGLGDGVYTFGGQTMTVRDYVAKLPDGTLAGGATPVPQGVRNAVNRFSVPLEDALRAATANPAKALRVYDEVGSLTVGKRADINILDKDSISVERVILGGKCIR